MASRFLDTRKSIEAILYVAKSTNDLFHIVKTLYFADKIHLENYGRLITGDHYIAMKDGPVPSGAYDIIKSVRGDGLAIIDENPQEAFRVEDWKNIIPIREPDLDRFSESDIECLDKAISIYARMDFVKLWKLAHREEPYKRATRDNDIPLEYIIQSLANANDIFEYLNS